MVTVKVLDIMGSVDTLNRLMTKELSAPTAYKIARLARKLNEEIESFGEIRKSTFLKYAGDGEEVPDDKVEEFESEINELLDVDVELDIQMIKLKDFGNATVRPSDMFVLEKFIDASE